METLSEREIIRRIQQGDIFEAQIETKSFEISIKEWSPAVFTAIHDGHQVDTVYAEKMFVSAAERKFEEDPYTAAFIEGFPITITGLYSRYQYDLNRSPKECIYDEAWGKKVWRVSLLAEERERILSLHSAYYRVLKALLVKIENRFFRCVLYDMHSYNYSRRSGTSPLFNIGTYYIDKEQFQAILNHLQRNLSSLKLPGVESKCLFDDVFDGKGYQAAFIKEHTPHCLCIPLEIKKVFMDEYRFDLIDDIFPALLSGLKNVLAENIRMFTEHWTKEVG